MAGKQGFHSQEVIYLELDRPLLPSRSLRSLKMAPVSVWLPAAPTQSGIGPSISLVSGSILDAADEGQKRY